MRARSLACLALVACAAAATSIAVAACDGQTNSNQYGEPIRVRGGQFFAGDLPGAPPHRDTADTADSDGGAPSSKNGDLAITTFVTANPVAYAGESSKSFSGRTTDNAVAIALRFADLGTGYWVVPVAGPDPQYPGELNWSASCDFDMQAPPGLHPLHVVPIAADGHAGTQYEQKLCLGGRVPDNLHACNAKNAVPEAIFSLAWDADMDVDLHVITPDGRDVSPKHPLVYPVDAGDMTSPASPVIDHDSLAACVPDGRRQEDLVFPGRPTGTWQVYANLFDACGKPSVDFTLTVYEPEGDGTARHLIKLFQRSGRLIDLDANGDTRPGLFIVEYPFD